MKVRPDESIARYLIQIILAELEANVDQGGDTLLWDNFNIRIFLAKGTFNDYVDN